jgi:hypothetical protein
MLTSLLPILYNITLHCSFFEFITSLISSLPTSAPQKMSKLGKPLKPCNILDIVNGNSSREHAENSIKYIENINKDVILPSVNSGRQAWAFMLRAFIIEGLI